MRRRISRDTYCIGGPDDVTLDFHELVDADMSYHPTPRALYDEDVWQRYIDARSALAAASKAVYEASVVEPLDAVEETCVEQYNTASNKYDEVAFGPEASEDEAVINAAFDEFVAAEDRLKVRMFENAKGKVKP